MSPKMLVSPHFHNSTAFHWQAYPSYFCSILLHHPPVVAAAAFHVNFPAWGQMCRILRDSLLEHYGYQKEEGPMSQRACPWHGEKTILSKKVYFTSSKVSIFFLKWCRGWVRLVWVLSSSVSTFSQGLRFPGLLRNTDLKSERASGQQNICLSLFLSISPCHGCLVLFCVEAAIFHQVKKQVSSTNVLGYGKSDTLKLSIVIWRDGKCMS